MNGKDGQKMINLDIEVLRAVAIVFTAVFHLDFLLFWGDETYRAVAESFTFWGGVDLFFCLSGFVIMRSLRGMVDRPDSDLSEFLRAAVPFWIRRACRLWPSAWLWIAIAVVCTFAFNSSGAFGGLRLMFSDAVAALIHAANFHWLDCLYNGGRQCNSDAWLLHIYWSLSLEEQFYFVVPFAMILVPRKRLIIGLAALIALQLFLNRPQWSPMWVVRTDALMMGMFIALWQEHASYRALEPVFLRSRWIAMPLFAVLVVMIAAVPSSLQIVSFSTGSLAVCCAVLVLLASYDQDYLWPRGFSKWVLGWVGSRSYSIYLTHLVCYALTRELWHRFEPAATTFNATYTLSFLGTALGLTLVFSEFNFRLVELPLRRRGQDIAAVVAAKLSPQPGTCSPAPTDIVHVMHTALPLALNTKKQSGVSSVVCSKPTA